METSQRFGNPPGGSSRRRSSRYPTETVSSPTVLEFKFFFFFPKQMKRDLIATAGAEQGQTHNRQQTGRTEEGSTTEGAESVTDALGPPSRPAEEDRRPLRAERS